MRQNGDDKSPMFLYIENVFYYADAIIAVTKAFKKC